MLAKVKKANKIKALGKSNLLLSNEQIKLLLAPLKRKGDAAMPSRKADILRRLTAWEARRAIIVDEEVEMVVVEAESASKRADLENEDQSDIALMEEV